MKQLTIWSGMIMLFASFTLLSFSEQEGLVSLGSSAKYDFSNLPKEITSARIIALGESSHGLGEMYRFKQELVRYLYHEHGYEVIALEAGFGDCNLAWLDEALSAEQLRDTSVFGNFNAAEILPLFQEISSNRKSKRPLIYTGFDSQVSGEIFYSTMRKLYQGDQEELDEIDKHADHYYKWYQALTSGDISAYENHMHSYKFDAQDWQLDVKHERLRWPMYLTKENKEIILRTLTNFEEAVDLPFDQRWHCFSRRDSLMYENLVWLLEKKYKRKKFIIWAHNAHIENEQAVSYYPVSMGKRLKDHFGDDYCSVGIFVREGEVYQHWTQESVPFDQSGEGNLESKMASDDQITFTLTGNASLSWLNDSINALEIENQGIVSFVPQRRFDALITLPHSGIPTFE